MVERIAPPRPDPEIIKALAALKPKDFAKHRVALGKLLGTSPTALEEEVADARVELGATQNLPFVTHLPAEGAVDPAALLSELESLFRRFIIVEPEQADAMALWTAHTHLVDVAEHSPLLLVNAPERECGKSLVQEVLGRIAQRAMFAANASTPAIFRAVEMWDIAMFFDEADTFFDHNPDLHGLVNAGHKRGGCVLRAESSGDSFEPKTFRVFCPKSIAGIALERHLPDATLSRGIVINMRRKLAHEKVERWRDADRDQLDRLARGLARLALDFKDQIRAARPKLPDELSDRAQDNWAPLLAIACAAGPEWQARAAASAIKLSGKATQPASTSNELLRDIRDVLAGFNATRIPTATLLDKLLKDQEMAWATYNRGQPFTARQLAKQLATYDIKPKTVRQPKTPLKPDGSTPKGYEIGQFEDAFTRYLKDQENDPEGPAPIDPTPNAVPGQVDVDGY